MTRQTTHIHPSAHSRHGHGAPHGYLGHGHGHPVAAHHTMSLFDTVMTHVVSLASQAASLIQQMIANPAAHVEVLLVGSILLLTTAVVFGYRGSSASHSSGVGEAGAFVGHSAPRLAMLGAFLFAGRFMGHGIFNAVTNF
jgi:hypothetical protein